MTSAVPFPEIRPPGYEWLPDEPSFDPERHLALTQPESVVTLRDLGYSDDEIVSTATDIAISAPFRVLSDEGAAVMLATARRLRAFAAPAGNRIEHSVRGGCYRSRFLRDLCLCEGVTDAMSAIYGTEVSPHTMPLHLGHLNYEPSEIDRAVDKWHHDTIPLDYVMMVSDPRTLPGGRFEYFVGTKAEAAELASTGRTPPVERVVAPDFGGAGWVVAMHGDMVVHRGAPLTAGAERITMVNAYVAADATTAPQSRTRDLIGVDDPTVLYTEWVRHAAWRSRERLDAVIESAPFSLTPNQAIADLEAAIDDVVTAIDDIRAGARDAEHYEL